MAGTVRYELHGAPTGNCFRAAIALEEAGLAYVPRRVDLGQGEHQGAGFRALNPRGKVPVLLEHEEGREPFVLTQSNAILLHIAERGRGRLLPEDARARSRCYERLLFFVTDVIAPSHAAFFLRRSGESGRASEMLDAQSAGALAFTEQVLGEHAFVAGEQFTLADICALTITRASRELLDWERLPQLRRWFERVSARPGVQRGFSAFDPPAA